MSEVEPTVLLNAAVFLASPPGAQRGQALPRQLRSPECHSLLLRGRAGADIRVPLPSAVPLCWWELLRRVVGGDQHCGCLCGWRAGSQAPLSLRPTGLCLWAPRQQEPQGIWPSLRLPPGSLGLQAWQLGVWDHRPHLCYCPGPIASMFSSPPPCRCTGVWNSPASCCF